MKVIDQSHIKLIPGLFVRMYNKAFKTFFLGFVFFSLVLPPLFPKKIFFILIVILFFLYLICMNSKVRLLLNPFALILLFLTYYLYGLSDKQDIILSNQFVFLMFSLFLIVVLYKFDICIEKYLISSSICLSLIILYMSAQYFFSFIPLSLPLGTALIDIFITYELGYIGFRQFGNFTPPMLHFISSPVLIIPLSILFLKLNDKFSKVKLLQFILIFVAITVSGSRGIILFSIMCCATLYFIKKNLLKKILIVLFGGGASLYFLSVLIHSGVALFDIHETSNSVKLGHAISFVNISNLTMLLFGNGLGDIYYSMGVQKNVAQTELMLLDLIRYFGVLGTLLFYGTLLFPLSMIKSKGIKLHHIDVNSFIIFLFYLIMATTNPILLNSYGVIVILWYWNKNRNIINVGN